MGECEEDSVVLESLTAWNLPQGINVLCCIHEVREYDLHVGLPGRLLATVPLTNVSDPYTDTLRSYAESSSHTEEEQQVSTLHAMFRPGMTLPSKVMEIVERNGRYDITASLKPSDVNNAISPTMLKHGMVLTAAIASIEDHGYVMDIGIKGLTGFLATGDAMAFFHSSNPVGGPFVGQLLQCAIDMPQLKEKPFEGRTVKLSTKAKLLEKGRIAEDADMSLKAILPGMTVPYAITQVEEQGLHIHCLGFSGFVHRDHLRTAADVPSSYEIGSRGYGGVLYVHPVTRNIALTLRPKPTPESVMNMFKKIHPGDVIKSAVVLSATKKIAVLKLKGDVKGLAIGKHLVKREEDLIEGEPQLLCIGSTHACRILSLHYLDQVALVTLRDSVLQEKHLSPSSLKVGAILEGTVKKLVPGGMIVNLAYGVQGFVRDLHLSDVPVKHPEVMFPQNKKVKCRVLEADTSQYPYSVWLTCKPSLVNSQLSVLSRYEDARPGKKTEGVVTLFRGGGLVLTFFGNVKGFVPPRLLAHDRVDSPEKIFFRGQVVKCTVFKCDLEKPSLTLSLINKENKKKEDAKDSKKVQKTSAEMKAKKEKKAKKKKQKKPKKDSASSVITSVQEGQKKMEELPVVVSPVQKERKEKIKHDGKSSQETCDVAKGSSELLPESDAHERKPHLQIDKGFVWDVDAHPNLSTLPQRLGAANLESDSDAEDTLEPPKKKAKTRKERQEELRKEEEFLTKQENLLMEHEREPSCVDDYERMVASSPNSSVVWMQYMTFHLQQAEFDKARAVGQRALQTISFREEQEKLNVWVAMLNLENMFGTKESLECVLQKALQYNDAQKVYSKMADIYERSDKAEEAEQVLLKMIKKYKWDKDVWARYGWFAMRQGRLEEARKLLNRALASVDKKEHVDLISRFAQMELKHGDPERGRTMLQNIVRLYPKRKDIKAILERAMAL